MYGFADILDDGRVVVGNLSNSAPEVRFGSFTVLLSTGAYLMFLRAVIGPDGKGYAVGQGNADGRAWLVCDDGRTLNLGGTFGVSCVCVTVNQTHLIVTAQDSATHGTVYTVDPAAWHVVQTHSVTFLQTSQGFADIEPDGTPILMDPIFRMVAGSLVGYVSYRPATGITVAQDNATGNPVMAGVTRLGTLAVGACFEPHQSPNGQYWVCRSTSTILGGLIPSVLPPYIPPGQPPEPEPPDPEPEPPDPGPEPPEPTPEPPEPIPEPEPEPEPMPQNRTVGVRLVGTDDEFQLVTEVDHPDGLPYRALQLSSGKYLSLTPQGTWQPPASSAGAWERFIPNGLNVYAVPRDAGVYGLEAVDCMGKTE